MSRHYTVELRDAEFGFFVADRPLQAKSIMDAKQQAMAWANGRAVHKDRVHNLRLSSDGYTVWFQQLPATVTAGAPDPVAAEIQAEKLALLGRDQAAADLMPKESA